MPVLTAIDLLGIQRYVFASNRLRDAAGASWLVNWATAFETGSALEQLGIKREDVLMAAGGNVILQFPGKPEAKAFAGRYSRLLIDKTPGLEAVIVHRDIEGSIADTLPNLHKDVARAKLERRPSVPLLGLGVTAACRETGLPAVGFDPHDSTIPLSAQILEARKAKDKGIQRLRDTLLSEAEQKTYTFPVELDDMGRSRGDVSFVGVVHIDGNGIGARLTEWVSKNKDRASFVNDYRTLSEALDKLATDTMQHVVGHVLGAIIKVDDDNTHWATGFPDKLSFQLNECEDGVCLPLRPILMGGDDLTFVCDGRIALSLAAKALNFIRQQEIAGLGRITACAGVALVKAHAPFARACRMAEELCATAKRRLRDDRIDDCAIDWHIGLLQPSDTVADVRQREYSQNIGATTFAELTCRPYCLGSSQSESYTWTWLDEVLLGKEGQSLRGPVWSERRNKVKRLQELVREGPDGLKAVLIDWKSVDKKAQLPSSCADGFTANRTALLDAIEMMDLHMQLDQKRQEAKSDT